MPSKQMLPKQKANATKTPSLAELQQWMRGILEARDGTAGAGRAAANIEKWISPSRTLLPAQRLDIYSSMYVYRLREVLTKDFPAVAYALGEHDMWHVTRDYIEQHPSRNPNLNLFNGAFPEYLNQRKDLKHRRFLSDLARLEWAMVETVHARSGRKPDLQTLQTLAPERWEAVTFTPSPTLRLLKFNYPVNDYLQAFREDKHPKIPAAKETFAAVQRVEFTIWRISLSRAMYLMLTSLAAGKSLRDAVKATLAARAMASSDLEIAIFKWFRNWVSDDFFEAITPPAQTVKLKNTPMFSNDRGGPKIKEEATKIKHFASEATLKSRGEAAAARAGRQTG